jgi:hypothetical protein
MLYEQCKLPAAFKTGCKGRFPVDVRKGLVLKLPRPLFEAPSSPEASQAVFCLRECFYLLNSHAGGSVAPFGDHGVRCPTSQGPLDRKIER